MDYSDKVVLVTGASRGIGRAVATAFGKAGAKVAGTATSEAGAEKITQRFKEQGITGRGYVVDVCDDEATTKVLSQIADDLGPIDILVNNAGITKDNILLRMRPEQWSAVIETNLNAVFRVTKTCMRQMLKRRWGRIINISSVVGTMGNAGQANYCASKAGVIGFSKALAQEMAVYGITCNNVSPGFIDTDMTRELTEQQREMILQFVPMKRMGEADDIANAVLFLASNQAGYITGQTLHVNGGMCMV